MRTQGGEEFVPPPEPEYDTKTVEFIDRDEDLEVTLLITRVMPHGADHLEDAGLVYREVIFTVIDDDGVFSSRDLHSEELHKGNSMLRSFMSAIKDGVENDTVFGIGWRELSEGFTYTPYFVMGMT